MNNNQDNRLKRAAAQERRQATRTFRDASLSIIVRRLISSRTFWKSSTRFNLDITITSSTTHILHSTTGIILQNLSRWNST